MLDVRQSLIAAYVLARHKGPKGGRSVFTDILISTFSLAENAMTHCNEKMSTITTNVVVNR
jgi:hypothetical protein